MMAEKDMSEKLLEEYNDVFSDIINVLVFHGERRIKPEELKASITRSQYKADTSKLHEQERDICKYWEKNGIELSICGIENQTEPEKLMPVRVIGYDGASYRSQLLQKKQIVPVATFVLYFGKKHWNYSKNLKDIFNIPEGMEDFVNNYKINVFEISWLSEEQVHMFESDFKVVAEYFVMTRKYGKNYQPDRKTIEHVDAVLKLMQVLTGDDSWCDVPTELKEKEDFTMCEVLEYREAKGREEGIEKGIEKGRETEREELQKRADDLRKEGMSAEQILIELGLVRE